MGHPTGRVCDSFLQSKGGLFPPFDCLPLINRINSLTKLFSADPIRRDKYVHKIIHAKNYRNAETIFNVLKKENIF
jgi:hypothetical protein